MEKPRHPMRDWRKAKGLTLQDVAVRVQVTPSHLSEIENWNNEPSLELASRLSTETGLALTCFVRPAERMEAAQ